MKAFALVDCNSFYCSCERVFAPATRGRPVIVLSNNDGCAISFSGEAKALGLGLTMAPFFQLREMVRRHRIAVFSSNYALYDDMSRRVMSVLAGHAPEMEVYSVDEAFLGFEGVSWEELRERARAIRADVLQRTGLPVGVGMARTKVLAKAANRLAKRRGGTWVLESEAEIDEALRGLAVGELWGVGRRSAKKLERLGVKTAHDFKYYRNEALIQRLFTKTGRQIQDELRGISCLPLEEAGDKDSIGSSRSFGSKVISKEDLAEALATFTTIAADKLRAQNGACTALSAYIQSHPLPSGEVYYGHATRAFPAPASDTFQLIAAAHSALEEMFLRGATYKKAGVQLHGVAPRTGAQLGLWQENSPGTEKLGAVMDAINRKYGAHTVRSAGCGTDNAWKTRCEHRSPRATTRWDELLRVRLT